ncbi:phage portal protein [Kitasatospora sp. NPDC090091]|uniref:phage portal protein n=1 Tax=Kitasatospora sp. NPDC090091 TaxID=3364081 RepID=UPI003821E13A
MTLADLTPEQWLKRLVAAHDEERKGLELMNAYYEGRQPLSYMAPELLNELQDRMRQVVINWPELIVDSLEERLDIEGFRYADSETTAEDLWQIWQANDLDEGSQQGHVDALALGRAYAIVGTNDEDDDMPLVTVESALQVHAEQDPRTRRLLAAVKRWEEPCLGAAATKMATLYLPNSRHVFALDKGAWAEQRDEGDEHGLGQLPVEMIANRPRLAGPLGRSELKTVIPLSDAACKIATDMMLSAEYHAMPRRWATGASRDDFADEQGNPLGAFSSLAGRLWVNEDPNVKYGQFTEAQLTNFHETINALARLVAALTGLPPHFLGLATANPPSADAIRSSEARLVKRAERRQRAFGGAWERVMRLALLVRDGEVAPSARSLETVWRDPSTPTYAQKADAVVKLHSAGILPTEQAWEDLGYSAEQRRRMREMQHSALERAMGGDLAAGYGPKPQPDLLPSGEDAAEPAPATAGAVAAGPGRGE